MISSLQPSRPKVSIHRPTQIRTICLLTMLPGSHATAPKPDASTTKPPIILSTATPSPTSFHTQKPDRSNASTPTTNIFISTIAIRPILQSRHPPPSLLLQCLAKSSLPFARHTRRLQSCCFWIRFWRGSCSERRLDEIVVESGQILHFRLHSTAHLVPPQDSDGSLNYIASPMDYPDFLAPNPV